jgi:lipopolysaccharide transport system ATP-binding protein
MIQFPGTNLVAPSGAIIGVIAEGACTLKADAVRLGPGDAIPETPGNYILENTLAMADSLAKSRAAVRLLGLRGAGASIVLFSYDEPLLESCADEIWWIRDNEVIARGDPAEVLTQYREHVADALRKAGKNDAPRLSPTMRKGDGRAVLEQIELLGEDGQATSVWRSGETVAIAVTVRFAARVEDPVVGIMIRTRIGLNVYGTNTELEKLKLGPAEAGDSVRVAFRFRCDLCPGQYTVTAASHDPDGLWHDWLEDAVAFSVSDTRYTAGVANLRATVSASRSSQTAGHSR